MANELKKIAWLLVGALAIIGCAGDGGAPSPRSEPGDTQVRSEGDRASSYYAGDSTCLGRCGPGLTGYNKDKLCQCDDKCVANGDCCSGYTSFCTSAGPQAAATDTTWDVGSCSGRCGTQGAYNSATKCQCDDKCSASGDCCSDYTTLCNAANYAPSPSSGSCTGRCGYIYNAAQSCQCDPQCQWLGTGEGRGAQGRCCTDYQATCHAPPVGLTANTCANRCNASYDKYAPCQCDAECSANGDCCSDRATLCGY